MTAATPISPITTSTTEEVAATAIALDVMGVIYAVVVKGVRLRRSCQGEGSVLCRGEGRILVAGIVTLRLRVCHVRSAVMIFVGIVISLGVIAARKVLNLERPVVVLVSYVGLLLTVLKVAPVLVLIVSKVGSTVLVTS